MDLDWDWDFIDDDLFSCTGCNDDNTPDPQVRRRNKTLCVRCDRAARQVRRYRITIPRRNAIMRFQGDVCALCQEGPPADPSLDTGSFWHIDHDHRCCPPGGSCGRCVRGLLCLPCNATRLPAYERLPDSPRFNTYLTSPPARHPAARPTSRDHTGTRDLHSSLIDAFFATTTDLTETNTPRP
ncbi:endonuclease domain-containing protein [Streptomyces sp. SAS_270]|uniref:endonuclease domain-containing protein n=1 Tax=Streptomyces sp. SAS_270 TaxID=3412748 RepID=UPI00403D403E